MPRSRCARFARSQPPPVCEFSPHPRRWSCGSVRRDSCVSVGRRVRLIERSRFPRHKVCGEFLSPGIESALGSIGLWTAFQDLRPAHIRRMKLRVGGAEKTAFLPDIAFGLSRHRLDAWLWDKAAGAGARHVTGGEPNIITVGRSSHSRRGGRLFGFKAHFDGPAEDTVELLFRRLDVRGCELR